MNDDLIEFIRARLDEDERVARWAGGGIWHDVAAVRESWLAECNREDATHILRHDPARIRAEVDAKRRILELGTCAACEIESQPCDHRDDVLALLALPYADHPDYRPEWSP